MIQRQISWKIYYDKLLKPTVLHPPDNSYVSDDDIRFHRQLHYSRLMGYKIGPIEKISK